jgi:hypothetical protein
MKFTFDGNIYENNNSSQDLKSDQKIILSGLIFESNTRLAALPFESEVKSFLLLDPTRRSEWMMDVWTKKSKADQAAFMDTWKKLEKNPSAPETPDEDKKNKGFDGFLDQMELIADKSTGVDDLAKNLECRFYVIQRLKSHIDTQKIGFYFTNLMSKQNLTEEKTCAILNRGADLANNTGARVENVLDFVVAAYDKIKSITLLDQFLKRAEGVLEKNRTIPVFQLLNKAINGEKANTRAYLMTIKDPQQMIILNELMTMVQAGPVENMEQLRRSWQASLDKVERQTEIYDRRIKVYNMFKSEAANYGMAHVIQSLGSLFKFFQKTGLLDVVTNIFYDLRAGKLAADAALSPITRNPINYPINQPGSVNSYNTDFRSLGHSGAKFVKIAQEQQSKQEESTQLSSPKPLFDGIAAALKALLSDPIFLDSKFREVISVINYAISTLSSFTDKTTLDDITKAFMNFADKFNNQGSTEQTSAPVTASNNNSNIRLAMGPFITRLVASLGPTFALFVRNQLTALANDPSLAFKFALSLSELIISVIRTYGAALWGKDLKRDPMFFDSAGRFLQNSPAAIAYTQTLSEAGYSTDQINAMITFKQVREQVKEKIRNYETKVKDVLAIPVQTGVNTTSESPLKSDASIQKITNGFILELRGAIVQFDKEIDFLRNLASEAQMQQRNQVALNLVTQHLREAEADLQNMKNLLGRYYSYDLTIANRNKTMQLMKVIGPMMSRINKFQTVGISTAALISNPQGIFPILNKIRQMQLDNIAKMKADLDVKKRSLPDNYYLEP